MSALAMGFMVIFVVAAFTFNVIKHGFAFVVTLLSLTGIVCAIAYLIGASVLALIG